jgi:hypothetical protein
MATMLGPTMSTRKNFFARVECGKSTTRPPLKPACASREGGMCAHARWGVRSRAGMLMMMGSVCGCVGGGGGAGRVNRAAAAEAGLC